MLDGGGIEPLLVVPHLQKLADHGIGGGFGLVGEDALGQFVPKPQVLHKFGDDVGAGRAVPGDWHDHALGEVRVAAAHDVEVAHEPVPDGHR